MIKQENLNALYDSAIKGEELTTKNINSIGLNSKDIKELVDTGKLTRVQRGHYELADAKDLLMYGKVLIGQKRHNDATKCFELGYKIDPSNGSICFQLFLRSIQTGNYSKAFELYETLANSSNKYYNQDLNFYLYILSIITDVPEKYQEYAKFLRFPDMSVSPSDKRYADSKAQNRIRTSVINKKLALALKQLNDQITINGSQTLQDLITKTLLTQAVNVEKKNRTTICALIKEKKYEEAKEFLLSKSKNHDLGTTEIYTIKVLSAIIDIKKSGKIPVIGKLTGENVFDAINNNNFNAALRMTQEHDEKIGVKADQNSLTLALFDICELIKELIQKREEKKEVMPEVTPQKEVSFQMVISNLLSGKTKEAFADLKEYMKIIGEEKYEFLIIDLIQIDLLDKDMAFTESMITLSSLSKHEFTFESSMYLIEFYRNLGNRALPQAKVYLDILARAGNLGLCNIDVTPLRESLEKSERIAKANEEVLKRIDNIPEEPEEQAEETYEEKVEQPKVPKEVSKKEPSDSEKEFLAKKHEELLTKKGAVLLKNMDEARANRLLEIASEYPDMKAFIVSNGKSYQVVLRYYEPVEEYIDYKKILHDAYDDYNEGRYDDCINAFLGLLQNMAEPNSKIYGRLGLAYMKKYKIDLAIEYLTIATKLAMKEGSDMDFTGLIERLQGKKSEEERKPHVNIREKEFNSSDINDFYGIDNFEEINDYIKESKLPVESACESLGLSLEQVDLIKLIYAREYFIRGDFTNGDIFMYSVERSANKTDLVKRVFSDIQRNRLFYHNREITTERPEIFIAKPR